MKNFSESHKKPTSFIRKTFKIVSSSKFKDTISWSEDGLSFIIKEEYNFTSNVLPKYFKHKNFSSFNRQLNMYDFHKVREDALEFSHPLFQRNGSKLLKNITRKNPEPNPNRVINEELGSRLEKFQLQQITMESILQGLELQYDKIVEQNQILINELMQSKQREKRIENYIKKIEANIKKEKKKEAHPPSSQSEEVLELSSLNSNE